MTFTWQPPVRPEWVTRFNDHAVHAGADAPVLLDRNDLLAAARAATGLDDFGDAGGWREHFDVFVESVQREGHLHLLGAMMTRTDILRALQTRLELTDLWTRRPEILAAPVDAPLFIVGAARSGTSILHELIALDPRHAVPTTWKVFRPLAAAVGDDADQHDARRTVDSVVRFWHDVQPEYEAMHHNHGDLPTECIFLTVPTFLSDNWGGTHTVPSYSMHLAMADQTSAYEWHKKTLQTLQLREPAPRWVLKAPSHLPTLQQLFAVYPDARVIHIHRDPARTMPSMFDLIGTLKWMRTDEVDIEPFIEPATAGMAHVQNSTIAKRADGTLPDDRFHDLLYEDLLADPAAAIEGAYDRFGWEFTNELSESIIGYLNKKPRGSKGAHNYHLATFGLTENGVRTQFADYLERFAIPYES